MTKVPNFKQKALDVVRKIPRGKTMSYAEVARLAGNSHAARAVGNIMNASHDPKIPCHRVIRSDGKMGGYNRGEELKRSILRKEGAIS